VVIPIPSRRQTSTPSISKTSAQASVAESADICCLRWPVGGIRGGTDQQVVPNKIEVEKHSAANTQNGYAAGIGFAFQPLLRHTGGNGRCFEWQECFWAFHGVTIERKSGLKSWIVVRDREITLSCAK
jgi:hypothetical protein